MSPVNNPFGTRGPVSRDIYLAEQMIALADLLQTRLDMLELRIGTLEGLVSKSLGGPSQRPLDPRDPNPLDLGHDKSGPLDSVAGGPGRPPRYRS